MGPTKKFHEQLRHPEGDAIIIAVDDDVVDVAFTQGPHEVFKVGLTYDQAGIVIGSLQRARRKARPRINKKGSHRVP